MKVIIVSTHDSEEIANLQPQKNNIYDMTDSESKFRIVAFHRNHTPEGLKLEGEVVYLFHGVNQKLLINYSSLLNYRFDCGTKGHEDLEGKISENRKYYLLLLNNQFEDFDKVWEFFFVKNSQLNKKLNFLHDIYNGNKSLDTIKEYYENELFLNSPRVKEAFAKLSIEIGSSIEKKYTNTDNQINELKNLRDEIWKL